MEEKGAPQGEPVCAIEVVAVPSAGRECGRACRFPLGGIQKSGNLSFCCDLPAARQADQGRLCGLRGTEEHGWVTFDNIVPSLDLSVLASKMGIIVVLCCFFCERKRDIIKPISTVMKCNLTG